MIRIPIHAIQFGGLGNRMFQQAAAIGYADKKGFEFSENEIQAGIKTEKIIETTHAYQSLKWPKVGTEAVLLHGYFQSEKYFQDCPDKIKEHFKAPLDFQRGVASIHVRRGDYLKYPTKHPVVSMFYITQAIKQLNSRGISAFQVFSDDIEWCKKSFEIYVGITFDFMPVAEEARMDIWRMATCEHNIIANSTFSWWGAWLNPNPYKKVISPSASNWFGPGNAHLDTKDIIPSSWIQIKY